MHGFFRAEEDRGPWRRARLAPSIYSDCDHRPIRKCSLDCRRPNYLASGVGRTWNFTTLGLIPLPPSWCQGVYIESLDQNPRPFHPAFGSSIRPDPARAANPSGYGTRSVNVVICPPCGITTKNESALTSPDSTASFPKPSVLSRSISVMYSMSVLA